MDNTTEFKPLTVLDVSQGDADRFIESAKAKAEEMNVPVVICVYSVRDRIKQLVWMDGAPLRSVHIATLKARTSMLMGKPTRELQERVKPGEPLHTIDRSNDGMIVVAGGYPIMHESIVIGGLGISGGTPEQDCEIAKHALGRVNLSIPSAGRYSMNLDPFGVQ